MKLELSLLFALLCAHGATSARLLTQTSDSISGTLEWLLTGPCTGGSDQYEYSIKVVDALGVESVKRLFFPGTNSYNQDPAETLLSYGFGSGLPISVTGSAVTYDLSVSACEVPTITPVSLPLASAAAISVSSWVNLGTPAYSAGWPPVSGQVWDVTSVTFILNFPNTAMSATPTSVQNIWFNSSTQTGYTLQGTYSTCSFNQYTFSPSRNIVINLPTMPSTGRRADGITPWSTSTCSSNDRYGWAEWAETYVRTSMPNINLSLYRHGLFLFNNPSCPFAGTANLGCGTYCRVWIQTGGRQPETNAVFHELGHNFNLNHAMGPDGLDYSDLTCAMGGCCATRCFNNPHSFVMGWSQPIVSGPQGGILSSMTPGTVYSFQMPAATTALNNHVQILANNWMAPGTNAPIFYVGYKAAVGADSGLSNMWLRRVNVYSFNATTQAGGYYLKSQLLSQITAGGVYDNLSSRLRVRFVSISGTVATVRVCRYTTTVSCSI